MAKKSKKSMRRGVLWGFSGGIAALLIAGGVSMLMPPKAAHAGNCKEIEIAVGLTKTGPKNQKISGTYCEPTKSTGSERELDLLLHGATYNRDYWDWPTEYPKYSYVDKTLNAGRATLAIDMLGAGKSSNPLALSLTTEAAAHAVHNVVQTMRSDYDYKKVNSISHSLGSIVAQNEAGIYQDVDRVVLTGMTHSAGTGLVTLFTSLYPALLDKKFAGSVTDPGYLTSLPNTRKMFYNSTVDPKVLEYDEQNKDMSPAAQIPGFPKTLLPPPLSVTQNIKVPIVVLVGAEDTLFCGLTLNCSDETQFKNNEKPFFPNASSFTARSVPATGHDLPLHPSADTSFSMIDSWVRSN